MTLETAQDDFDRAACGLALIAPDGRFVRVNATLSAWLGYSRGELQARRFHDVLTIGSKLFHQTHWMPLLQMQRSVAEVQLELVTRDGRVVPMLVNAVLRPGDPSAALIDLATFVTADRRKYERELLAARQRAEDLLLQAREAQAARDAAEASLRADAEQRAMVAEQLMGIVSHDLRNPLHAVLLGTQLLTGSDLPQSSQRVVLRVTAAAQRATRLVSDILDFTRARLGGGLRMSVQRVDLHALVADCLDEARLAWPGRAIVHEARGMAIGSVDPDRFAQIVSNLINNALSYGEPSQPVVVISTVAPESIELSVHNAGPPIAESVRERIFEPMQRGEGEGPSTRSVGLGLYIVREIVNAHRGSIVLRSSAEAGTQFVVTLPNAGSS